MHEESVPPLEEALSDDSALGIVVWMNPESDQGLKKRLLGTLTRIDSADPAAFPIESIRSALRTATVATSETISDDILASTKENPLIIPVELAQECLGWTDFCVVYTIMETK